MFPLEKKWLADWKTNSILLRQQVARLRSGYGSFSIYNIAQQLFKNGIGNGNTYKPSKWWLNRDCYRKTRLLSSGDFTIHSWKTSGQDISTTSCQTMVNSCLCGKRESPLPPKAWIGLSIHFYRYETGNGNKSVLWFGTPAKSNVVLPVFRRKSGGAILVRRSAWHERCLDWLTILGWGLLPSNSPLQFRIRSSFYTVIRYR